MKRFLVLILCFSAVNACKKPSPDGSPPQDTSTPTLAYPLASYSSVVKFIPFGASTSSGLSKGYWFWFSDTTQNLVAASPGIISAISTASDGTPQITVKYKSNSIYSFIYSGFRQVQVGLNDSIAGGSILGTPAYGWVYFELIKDNQALCPLSYSSPGFNNSIALAINRNNQYNPTDSVFSACSIDSLPK